MAIELFDTGKFVTKKRNLPSLNALLFFEASARHLSFRRAADELCVTPTAVRHQIRYLEEWLGRSLFERKSRPMALTEFGLLLYPLVTQGMDSVDEGINLVRQSLARTKLTVSVTSTFGAWWLAQRLGSFVEQHPDIDLRVRIHRYPRNWSLATCI